MLRRFILFHAIDVEETWINFTGIGHERERSSFWKYVYGVYDGTEQYPSLETFEEELQERGLITADDVAWAEGCAMHAACFVKEDLAAKLIGTIEQLFHESAIHSLDKAVSRTERQHLLELSNTSDNYPGKPRKGGRESRFDLDALTEHYESLLPIWKEAKKDYKDTQKYPLKKARWVKVIDASFDLPSDLIARLAEIPDLPDELLAKIAEKGGTSKPSDIALEHASRRCGAPPYEYAISSLWDQLRKYRIARSSLDTKS